MLDVIYYDKNQTLQRKEFTSEEAYEQWLDEVPDVEVVKVKY